MNQAVQEGSRRHMSRETQRRALAQLAALSAAADDAAATVPRPNTTAQWADLPETWPGAEDAGLDRDALRAYTAARQKCVEAAARLAEEERHRDHLRRLADTLETLTAACAPDSVERLANELHETQATGKHPQPNQCYCFIHYPPKTVTKVLTIYATCIARY